jgi:hypothetical protein
MKKETPVQTGIINIRTIVAVALCSLGASLGWLSLADTTSNTITPANTVLTYDRGPFNVPNQSPLGLGQLDVGPRCNSTTFPCDIFALTVTLPAGYAAAHPNAGIKVTLSWNDTGSHQSEYDLYVYNGVITTLDGSQPSNHASTGANPEVTTINPVVDGTNQYSIIIVPFTPTQEIVHARVELLPGDSGVNPFFGAADPTTPGVPRYHIFEAPAAADSTQGEFNIGFDPKTKRIMTMNIGPIWRLTPPEVLIPAEPECCEGLWENKSNAATNIGLDPILWTDQKTGRTFVSNSTAGANAVYGYTDAAAPFNDGDQWVPFAPSSPNFSDDHETLGSGPYPLVAGMPNPLATAANQGEAVYYCGQTFPVGSAECQRSDTLGASFGPGVVVYNGVTSNCGGLHGHVRVAPDGTAWLPVKKCPDIQGGALSTTAGATWTEFIVTGSHSQPQGADPSIGIDSDSTIYYSYVNNEPVPTGNPPEGHPHVRVGHRNADNSVTWGTDVDLGASHGIRNAVEIEAVGGSSGRAAVGFLGTDVNGDYQSVTFPGKWYAFIATTYDGGQHWTTVNATPNDPVQSMTGVWQQGGNQPDRNLLDFNEITIDDKGQVLYGYSDGCVTPDCIAGAAPDDFVADIRVARQSGGKTLKASNDTNTDTTAAKVPKPACLSGFRDPLASHLTWKVPDNGGADITSYEIWRGTVSGNETKLFTTLNPDPRYDDLNPPTNKHLFYYVKAINSAGTGTPSNEIDLVVVPPLPPESICTAPGLTKLTDPQGDTSIFFPGLVTTPAPPGADLKSFQLTQPFEADGIPRLVFTINTWDNGHSPQPTGSAWYVAMKIPGPDPTVPGDTSAVHYRGVHMIWNSTTPTFESYIPGANGAGGVDGRFVASVIGPAEASSSYAPPFNKVIIVVKASDLGLNPGDTISGFVSGVSQTEPGPAGGTITGLYDDMPDGLGFANSYVVNHNNICAPLPAGIVSRMVHGAAGPFDISLPTTGTAGIECRSGGTSNAYTLIYTFGTNLGFPGAAAVTQGTATVGAPTIGPNLNQVTVPLTGVTNAQHLVVTLRGVEDASNVTLASQAAPMGVLIGDVNATGGVDGNDVAAVQSHTRQPVTSANFRFDVNASGGIDGNDVSLTQSHTRTALP